MNGQKEHDLAGCTHIHVERFTVEKDGKVFEEQWRCRDCGTKFVSLGSLFGGPQKIQLMEPVKTLRDEFAIEVLNAYISSDASGTSFWRTKEQRAETVAEAYLWAESVLEARQLDLTSK